MPEWPKGTGCKPVGIAFGGSNPPRPTKTLMDELAPLCPSWHRVSVVVEDDL